MSRKATRQVEAPADDSRLKTPRSGFALRLHAALAEASLSTEDFARQIDRPLRTVQRWRNGQSEPTGAALVLIARELDRDPSWFYNDGQREAA